MTPETFDHAALATQRYLRPDEAAAYFRFPSAEAFVKWAKRQGLLSLKTGRLNLYLRTAIEGHIERHLAERQDAQRPRLVRRRKVSA
jgi:hypothetical protein